MIGPNGVVKPYNQEQLGKIVGVEINVKVIVTVEWDQPYIWHRQEFDINQLTWSNHRQCWEIVPLERIEALL